MAELDGVNKTNSLFVLAATNRPDLLDNALLRPGRFDRLVYIGVPETPAQRLATLRALTRKFALEPRVDLSRLVERMPPNLSGADLYSFCADALTRAIHERADEAKALARGAGGAEAAGGGSGRGSDGKGGCGGERKEQPRGVSAEGAATLPLAVGMRHFEAAIGELQPSVSEAQAAQYRQAQQRFSVQGGGSAQAVGSQLAPSGGSGSGGSGLNGGSAGSGVNGGGSGVNGGGSGVNGGGGVNGVGGLLGMAIGQAQGASSGSSASSSPCAGAAGGGKAGGVPQGKNRKNRPAGGASGASVAGGGGGFPVTGAGSSGGGSSAGSSIGGSCARSSSAGGSSGT